MAEPDSVYCSFCGKANHETDVMVAGPVRVFICDECVEGCVQIVAQKRRDNAMMRDVVRCAFCLPTPIAFEVRHG